MKDKKHIDRIFQERLKDFEEKPDPKVWESIHNSLHEKDRDRKGIPLWWKLAGVAAGFLLLLTAGIWLLNEDFGSEKPNTQVTEGQSNDISPDKNKTFENVEQVQVTENEVEQKSEQEALGENASKNSNIITSTPTDVVSQSNSNSTPTNSKPYSTEKTSKTGISKSDRLKTDVAINENEPAAIDDSSETNNDESGSQTFPKSQTTAKPTEGIANTKISFEDNIQEEDSKFNIEENPASGLLDLEDAVAESETTNEKEKPQINRWAISPNVAPVYFNSLGKGSPIHPQFIDNTKAGEVEMSYGVTGSYAVSNKLKVRLGINNVNLGYTTGDVIVYEDITAFVDNDEINGNIEMQSSYGNTSLLSATSINRNEAPDVFVSSEKGAIDQEFGFVEIPLELEYNLFQNKFGLNVIGGFSTFFLSKNKVYTDVSNIRQYVGEATNLNSTSYSANIGLGLNYNISKLLDINLEPIFKYQFNTFTNTSGNFKPYIFGVYSGVRFKF